MGEAPDNVWNIGAGIFNIKNLDKIPVKQIEIYLCENRISLY